MDNTHYQEGGQVMSKIAFEMREDERVLTRLEVALDFAVAELSEGFALSNIYNTDEGKSLIRDVEDDICKLDSKVARLKELALEKTEEQPVKNIKSSEICTSKEDLESLKDASVYHIEDVTSIQDGGEKCEGVEITFKLPDGHYIGLSLFEDGMAYLSEQY